MNPTRNTASKEMNHSLDHHSILRIGLLIDSWIQPQWIYRIVSDIQSSSIATICLVVKENAAIEKPPTLFKRISNARKYFLYHLYQRIDDFKNRSEPDAFEKKDIQELLRHCPVVEEEIKVVSAYDLDIALDFSGRPPGGKVLQMAKYGVWSYLPVGFWEVLEGEPTTGSFLQVSTEKPNNGKVIYGSDGPTDPFSVRKNRNNACWKSAAFVMRKLRDLSNDGPRGLDLDSSTTADDPSNGVCDRKPANSEMFRLLFKLSRKYASCKIRRLFQSEQWFLAYRMGERQPLAATDTFHTFKQLIPPKGRFWADPFPVKKEDSYFVFFEEYLEKNRKGCISVLEIDSKEIVKGAVKVLEREFHLAYPFLFQWQGNDYMIPETAANKTIELYRCVSFPDQWKLEKVLMSNVHAADATLVQIGDLWWMFVCIAVNGVIKNWDELHLFYADNPLGPWKPHKRNPVKSDVRSARPAGRVFEWNGNFYRPAQDCSQRYGYAVSFQKIVLETEVSKIFPEWEEGLIGTHTFNQIQGLTVIDGLRIRKK
jgi:hypothetical protein